VKIHIDFFYIKMWNLLLKERNALKGTLWLVHGAHAPILQKIALKLLGQPCSSSCYEKNWSTYFSIHSLKRNKMTPQRVDDLVFVHNNFHLLSRNSPQYNQGKPKM